MPGRRIFRYLTPFSFVGPIKSISLTPGIYSHRLSPIPLHFGGHGSAFPSHRGVKSTGMSLTFRDILLPIRKASLRRLGLHAVAASALAVLSSAPAWSQATSTATIAGLVTDEQNAAV